MTGMVIRLRTLEGACIVEASVDNEPELRAQGMDASLALSALLQTFPHAFGIGAVVNEIRNPRSAGA